MRAATFLQLSPARLVALVLGFAAALISLAVFGELAEDVYERETIRLDAQAGTLLHGYATPPLDAAMTALSLVGSWPVLLALLVIVTVGLLRVHRQREVVFLMLALGGGTLLSTTLKLLFHRPRPMLPWSPPNDTYSFPSGHAMHALTLYLGLACVAWVLWGSRRGIAAVAGASLLVLAIGISRIYLGEHYLSDVIGGYSAGVCWMVGATLALEGGRRLVSRRIAARDHDARRGKGDTATDERGGAR